MIQLDSYFSNYWLFQPPTKNTSFPWNLTTYIPSTPPHDPSGARDPSPIGELTLELLGGKTRLSGAVMARKGCLPFKPK